jgi:hypothetical protein
MDISRERGDMSAFTRPIHIRPDGGASLPERIPLGVSESQYDEKWLQAQLFAFPQALPITEIDPHAGALVPICTELRTDGGPADILYVTRTGKIVLVETKLWRNSEARRIVVAQILDYAKELSGWTYEDLAREAAQASKGGPEHLLKSVRAAHPELDEAAFVDGINRSLAEGDFILVIAGDGIRSGAEALVSFLERFGNLRFHFALVEIASYRLADGALLLQPRVLAKTELLRRTVYMTQQSGATLVMDDAEVEPILVVDRRRAPDPARGDLWLRFWQEYLAKLVLDDLQQPLPQAVRTDRIYLQLPPGGRNLIWITAYVARSERSAGVFLTLGKNLPRAAEWYNRLYEDREEIETVVPDLQWIRKADGNFRVEAPTIKVAEIETPADRDAVLRYLCDDTNRMVNAFRHRLVKLVREDEGTAS